MVTANDMDTIAAIQSRAKDAKSGGSGKIADQNAAPKGAAPALDTAPEATAAAPGAADLATKPDTSKGLGSMDKLNAIAKMYQGLA